MRIALRFIFIFLFLIGFALLISILFKSKGTGDFWKWQQYVDVSVKKPYDLIPACLKYQCQFPYWDGTYPPGYFLLIYSLSQIIPVNFIGTFKSVKFIILFFYLLTLFSLILINIRLKNKKFLYTFISTTILYASLLSLSINSVSLGYTDIFIFPFIIFSFYFLSKNKIFLSGLFFSTAVQLKWLPLITLPFLLIYLIKSAASLSKSLKYLLLFLIAAIIPVLLQIPINNEIFPVLYKALTQGAYFDRVFSQALNAPWITTYFLHLLFPNLFGPLVNGLNNYIVIDNLSLFGLLNLPKLFFWSIFIIFMIKFIFLSVNKNLLFLNFLLFSILGYSTYFVFASGVHENHLTFAVLLVLLLYLFDHSRKSLILLFSYDIINLFNMVLFYGLDGAPINRSIASIDISVPLSSITIGCYLYLSYYYPKIISVKKSENTPP